MCIRDRDYGYDHNGELVLVNKLDPERMPAFAVGMKVKVMEKKETSAEASARRIKDLRASRLNEVDYIQPQESGQPSAMESMKMAKCDPPPRWWCKIWSSTVVHITEHGKTRIHGLGRCTVICTGPRWSAGG